MYIIYSVTYVYGRYACVYTCIYAHTHTNPHTCTVAYLEMEWSGWDQDIP